jgi:hypothetical protein
MVMAGIHTIPFGKDHLTGCLQTTMPPRRYVTTAGLAVGRSVKQAEVKVERPEP